MIMVVRMAVLLGVAKRQNVKRFPHVNTLLAAIGGSFVIGRHGCLLLQVVKEREKQEEWRRGDRKDEAQKDPNDLSARFVQVLGRDGISLRTSRSLHAAKRKRQKAHRCFIMSAIPKIISNKTVLTGYVSGSWQTEERRSGFV